MVTLTRPTINGHKECSPVASSAFTTCSLRLSSFRTFSSNPARSLCPQSNHSSSRFIHAVACFHASFFLWLKEHLIVWLDPRLFICSSAVDVGWFAPFGCYELNCHQHSRPVPVCTEAFISWGYKSGVELLGALVTLCFIFWGTCVSFLNSVFSSSLF